MAPRAGPASAAARSPCSIGREADVRRPVAQHEQRDEARREQHRDDEGKRAPPSVVLSQLRQQRQEDELSGRVARGQHADDKSATLDEPARRDRRARAPGRRDRCRRRQRRPTARRAARPRSSPATPGCRVQIIATAASDDRPHAEAVDEGGRKRRHRARRARCARQAPRRCRRRSIRIPFPAAG